MFRSICCGFFGFILYILIAVGSLYLTGCASSQNEARLRSLESSLADQHDATEQLQRDIRELRHEQMKICANNPELCREPEVLKDF